MLELYLRKNNTKIERGTRAETIEHNTEHVEVCVMNTEGQEERITCQYLVGCDGAHSIVRKSTSLTFAGGAYPQDFILADLRMKWTLKNNISIFMGSHGFMALFPMKNDVWRIICSRVNEKHSKSEPTLLDFQESIRKLCPTDTEVDFTTEEPLWMTRFNLHHRIVDNYREGRCFLAGDSCHIHSPAGGQGMNSSMQDSINLAWKLAMVFKGEQKEELLETYNTERRRIGEHLLSRTDRGFEFMATSSPVSLWLRNTLTPWILAIMDLSEASKRSRFRFVSELGVRYRHSPIVSQGLSRVNSALRGGDRMPDAKILGLNGEMWLQSLLKSPNHHVLVFYGLGNQSVTLTGLIESFRRECVNLHDHIILDSTPAVGTTYNDELGVVHRVLGMEAGGLILVRPDGYIEWIGDITEADDLKDWLRSCT